MEINGKRIVLTGAASGIGQALLELLAAYTAQIVAADINGEGLEAAVGAISAQAEITPFVCDLSLQENVDNLFDFALQTMGGIDLFIANAGFAYYEKIEQADWGRIERIYRLNVFSPIYAAEKMCDINGGHPHKVVITASAMGLLSLPGYALYSSTKSALHRFAEGYRFELDNPSALTLVYPIGTRTKFFKAAADSCAPMAWPTQTPEQVAKAIVRGIERDKASIHPSWIFRALLFGERFLPFLRRIEQAIEKRRFERWLGDRAAP